MSKDLNQLREIVEIARDGERFYRDAETRIRNPGLQPLLSRMAEAKRELVEALSRKIAAGGVAAPESGTLAGTVRKVYTDVAAKLTSQDAQLYVAQLEETEDRLLEHVEKAAAEASDTSIRVILQAYLPKVRACHDEMRELKHRLAA